MSHELSMTVDAPDGTGQINIPLIFPGQLPGLDPAKPQTLTDAHKRRAIERAYALSRLGVKFRAFPSISEAVEAARQASEAGPAASAAPFLPGGQLEGADVAVEPRRGSLADIGETTALTGIPPIPRPGGLNLGTYGRAPVPGASLEDMMLDLQHRQALGIPSVREDQMVAPSWQAPGEAFSLRRFHPLLKTPIRGALPWQGPPGGAAGL